MPLSACFDPGRVAVANAEACLVIHEMEARPADAKVGLPGCRHSNDEISFARRRLAKRPRLLSTVARIANVLSCRRIDRGDEVAIRSAFESSWAQPSGFTTKPHCFEGEHISLDDWVRALRRDRNSMIAH
jgi:hypothetical protein